MGRNYFSLPPNTTVLEDSMSTPVAACTLTVSGIPAPHTCAVASPVPPVPLAGGTRPDLETLAAHGPRVTVVVEVDLAAMATAERRWITDGHGRVCGHGEEEFVDWDEDQDFTWLDFVHGCAVEDDQECGPVNAQVQVLGPGSVAGAVWLAYSFDVPSWV